MGSCSKCESKGEGGFFFWCGECVTPVGVVLLISVPSIYQEMVCLFQGLSHANLRVKWINSKINSGFCRTAAKKKSENECASCIIHTFFGHIVNGINSGFCRRLIISATIPRGKRCLTASSRITMVTPLLIPGWHRTVGSVRRGAIISKNKKENSGDCTTVATQPRQLHYSNNLSKKNERR